MSWMVSGLLAPLGPPCAGAPRVMYVLPSLLSSTAPRAARCAGRRSRARPGSRAPCPAAAFVSAVTTFASVAWLNRSTTFCAPHAPPTNTGAGAPQGNRWPAGTGPGPGGAAAATQALIWPIIQVLKFSNPPSAGRRR